MDNDIEALKYTTKAIEYCDQDYYFFKNRLKCHLRMSNFKEAVQDSHSALALLTSKSVDKAILAEVYSLLGNANYNLGKRINAEGDLKIANDLCPQYYYPYILLSFFSMSKTGSVADAIKIMKNGIHSCEDQENLMPLLSFFVDHMVHELENNNEQIMYQNLLTGIEKYVLGRID
jgi:tetratricopeptide (TPR) repeat protein